MSEIDFRLIFDGFVLTWSLWPFGHTGHLVIWSWRYGVSWHYGVTGTMAWLALWRVMALWRDLSLPLAMMTGDSQAHLGDAAYYAPMPRISCRDIGTKFVAQEIVMTSSKIFKNHNFRRFHAKWTLPSKSAYFLTYKILCQNRVWIFFEKKNIWH